MRTLTLLLLAVSLATAEPVKHRFLAMDESRAQLIYVDETDPARDWSIKFPARYRDVQLIGGGKVLVSTNSGYREYDLATQAQTKELRDGKFGGSESVRRLANGETIIGCNQKGVTFYRLDAHDQVVATANFPKCTTLRLFRLSPRGTLLFGGNTNKLFEGNFEGQLLRDLTLPGSQHNYQLEERPDGHLLVGTGYGCFAAELDPAGKVLRQWGGKQAAAGGPHFIAGLQVLANGHLVLANWTGHGAQDSKLAPQLLEYDTEGTLVWSWHNAERAGSLVGVIILDGLDTSKLYDDRGGVLTAAN